MDISNQIKTRREAMGLSQEQLAEKLYVSRQTISNWERDKTYPDVQSLLMLSILFGTSIDTLVKGDVTVMEEAVERDRKRMGTRMLWLAVLMLALLAVAFALILSPAFNWMEGTWGAGVAAAAAFLPAIAALGVAPVLERIKRENDLVTYREILAFMNGEADIERDPQALPRRAWPTKHRLANDLVTYREILAVRNADRCFTATSAIVSTTRCSAPEPLAVDDGLADHDVEDLDVGILHANAAHIAHAGDRLFHRILNQALAGTEAAALHGHIVAQNRRINGSGNITHRGHRLGLWRLTAGNAARTMGCAQRKEPRIGKRRHRNRPANR